MTKEVILNKGQNSSLNEDKIFSTGIMELQGSLKREGSMREIFSKGAPVIRGLETRDIKLGVLERRDKSKQGKTVPNGSQRSL